MHVPLFAPRRAQPTTGTGGAGGSFLRSEARGAARAGASPAAPPGHSYARDAAALVLLVSALYSALALASFRGDPLRPEVSGEDWVGPVGAALAGASVQAVGVIAWFGPVELALLAMPLLGAKRSNASLFRLSGDVVVVVVLAALAHVAFPQAVAFGAMPLGGAVGELFGELLRSLFSNIGSYIIGLTVVALILMGRATFSFIELAQRTERAVVAIASRIAGWVRALCGAWAAARDLERRAAKPEKEAPLIARNSSPDAIIAALADDEGGDGGDDPFAGAASRGSLVGPESSEAPALDVLKGGSGSAALEEPSAAPKPRRGRKAQPREPREAAQPSAEPRIVMASGEIGIRQPDEDDTRGARQDEAEVVEATGAAPADEATDHSSSDEELATAIEEPEASGAPAAPKALAARARRERRGAQEPHEAREPFDGHAPREAREPFDGHAPREAREPFEAREPIDEHAPREAREPFEAREPQATRAGRELRPGREPRRGRATHEVSAARGAREPFEAQTSLEGEEPEELDEPIDAQALLEAQEPEELEAQEEPIGARSPHAGRGARALREPREGHGVRQAYASRGPRGQRVPHTAQAPIEAHEPEEPIEAHALLEAQEELADAFEEPEALDVPTPSPILPVRGAHAPQRSDGALAPYRQDGAHAPHRQDGAHAPHRQDGTSREIAAGAPERPRAGRPSGPTIVDTSRALVSEKAEVVRVVPAVAQGFRLPTTDMLEPPAGGRLQLDAEALKGTAQLLEKTLADYGVNGKVEEIHPGPTVTTFEVSPAAGTKVSKVAGLADDLALGLSRKVRIVAPIPGKNRIGFEIPNEHRLPVNLRELVEDRRFLDMKAPLPCVLGRDIIGTPYFADLASMPHVIVAGATGAGKSVGLNVMLVSLLFRKTPEELRLLMIDPKVVELAPFDRIPHLLLPVVTDMKQAANALKWAVDEMERRYQLFANAGTKNITTYNAWVERVQRGEARPPKPPAKVSAVGFDGTEVEVDAAKDGSDAALPEKIPFIVIVVDEFADLMMQQGKDVEASVARLAQKARAAGMHVILATQRPSVDVITGMIKANFPTRIAFRVAQKVDSRTILDEQGAEHLLGRGDMLIKMNGANETRRVQCPFCSEEEVQKITDFLRLQGEPVYDEAILRPRDEDGEEPDTSDAESDPMYDAAVRIVADTRRCSTSWLQRKLGVGYNRAAKLVEAMEKRGLVGPANGAKDREVLISPL